VVHHFACSRVRSIAQRLARRVGGVSSPDSTGVADGELAGGAEVRPSSDPWLLGAKRHVRVCYVLLGAPGARPWARVLLTTVVAAATELTRGVQSSDKAAMVRRLDRATQRTEGSCGLQLRHTVALGCLVAAA
jgi:hypothetical protein